MANGNCDAPHLDAGDPEPDGAVSGGRRQQVARGRKVDALHAGRVAHEAKGPHLGEGIEWREEVRTELFGAERAHVGSQNES